MSPFDGVTAQPAFDFADRYRVDSGPVLITGVQAIARQFVEQHVRDQRAGRRVATFVSGYQGSPLAGLDKMLTGIPELATDHDVSLVPAVNEEIAATSVWGSQLELPTGTATHDGVVGVWYGKGPGLDRASDALRHGAMYGANAGGGALVLVGDDPGAKSSSLPAASERSLAALSMPVFFPRNAEEIIAFGLYAVALSRLSGCWASMKIVADVADGLWTLDRNFEHFDINTPDLQWEGRPWTYRQRVLAAPPDSVLAEADLHGPRWAMVEAFNDVNAIDAIEIDCEEAWLGIVAVGTAYDCVRQALRELGLDDDRLAAVGVRILRVGMPYPLGKAKVRELATGVDTVLVVEEKTAFVETQVKDALYGTDSTPSVVGKRSPTGTLLVPADGALTAARLLGPLRTVLGRRVELAERRPPALEFTVLPAKRGAYFCSGCPHNRSTAVPEGSLAGGGIGCHTLVTMSAREDSKVTGLTQMGGEGAQWIGQAPFTDIGHIFQNIGDGTYFHSGQLAVQACIAAGVDITYKILFNSAVAMTGAQRVEAGLDVPSLTRKLTSEGVAKIIVCAEDPTRHEGADVAPGVEVWHRDRLDEAQRVLRDIGGVTVLIYDQECAAEARRKRKRGTLAPRRTRVVINEAVCEGCGDCGVKSNCLSVQPVDTEFGRKTRIDQSSCNTDYSCLDGECPSFVTVELPEAPPVRTVLDAPAVPDPEIHVSDATHNVFLAGIGGTGVVTVNQVLGMAALRSGLHVEGVDQTGLSQKAGPVTSHLRLSPVDAEPSNRIGVAAADCILAFDLLTAADTVNIGFASPTRTLTIASTALVATGAMVYDPSVPRPSVGSLLDRLDLSSKRLVGFDASAAAAALCGDASAANFIVVGAAFQAGGLPVPAYAIEEAISINGVAVRANQAAFRWGRVAVADRAVFDDAVGGSGAKPTRTIPPVPTELMARCMVDGAIRGLVERRAAELVVSRSAKAASRYLSVVETVWCTERAIGDRTDFSEAVAQGLFSFMAYKDEYEVARLLTDPAFLTSVDAQVPGGSKLTYQLQPPALAALKRKKKLGLGPRFHPSLRVLAKAKALRGTRLDPFGYTTVRRLERALIEQYEAMVLAAANGLTAASYDRATDAAAASDLVRGYEGVKLRNIERYRARLAELGLATPNLSV